MTNAEITALAERLENDHAPYWDRQSTTALGVETAEGYLGRSRQSRSAATALRALLAEREAIKPFIDLAVATTVEGSPDYREWVGQANDWTIVFAFAGRSITLGQLRALSALAPKEPTNRN
jgi:hypothetical protein